MEFKKRTDYSNGLKLLTIWVNDYRTNPNETKLNQILFLINELEKSKWCECNLKFRGINC